MTEIIQRNETHVHHDYTARNESRAGKEFIVVPVVMMVEGVHHGSGGPTLHLQENFSQNPEDWNGAPLTAGHPENQQGQYISAKEADPDQWIVGYVDNAHVKDGKLKAEAWIDKQRAIAINPEVVNYITEGKKLEVSTGAVTRDSNVSGQHNGEQYNAVTLEYRPDHLALLPGDQGACSWRDGCGIRTNKKEDSNEMNEPKKERLPVVNNMQSNAAGYQQISEKIRNQLDRRDSEARHHYLVEIYDDHFIYKVHDRDQGKEKYYKQPYAMKENDEVDYNGDPTEVRRDVEYVAVQTNTQTTNGSCSCTMKRTKFNANNNDTEETMSSDNKNAAQPSGEVMDRVVSLINNERTRFSKADRTWLLNLNEDQLEKLLPTEPVATEVSREDALQALQADLSDTEKLVAILPEGVKEQVQHGIKAYADQREKHIKTIQANTDETTWPKDVLNGMETDHLARIAKSVQRSDYSGQGGTAPVVNNSNGHDEEMLLPAGVEIEK